MYQKINVELESDKEQLHESLRNAPYLKKSALTNISFKWYILDDETITLYQGKYKKFSYFYADLKIQPAQKGIKLMGTIKGAISFYFFLPLVIFMPLLFHYFQSGNDLALINWKLQIQMGIFGMIFLTVGTFIQAYAMKRMIISTMKKRVSKN